MCAACAHMCVSRLDGRIQGLRYDSYHLTTISGMAKFTARVCWRSRRCWWTVSGLTNMGRCCGACKTRRVVGVVEVEQSSRGSDARKQAICYPLAARAVTHASRYACKQAGCMALQASRMHVAGTTHPAKVWKALMDDHAGAKVAENSVA